MLDFPTQTIEMPRVTDPFEVHAPRDVREMLQENVNQAHSAYRHALVVQESLTFSAWLNSERDLAEREDVRRKRQVAWALRGGKPGRRWNDKGGK